MRPEVSVSMPASMRSGWDYRSRSCPAGRRFHFADGQVHAVDGGVLAKLFDHIDDLQIRFAAVRQRRAIFMP